MFDWNEKAPLLNAKLDPKHVTQRAMAGRTLDYIEGWWAIAEANRIFGFGGWSFQIDHLELISKDLVDGKYGKQWRVCYSCAATAIVGGVRRQDVGFGQGQAKPEDLGAALESAGKEAATDAMKRCLRTFGNPFGLALYDKTKANVGVDAPVKRPERVGLPHHDDLDGPSHDPETGEIPPPRNNPAQAASDGLHDAWKDGVTDMLPFPCSTPAEYAALTPQQRGVYWIAFADALVGAFKLKKSAAGVSAQWDKRDSLIMEMQEANPPQYHRVLDAFNESMKRFAPAEEMAATGNWGG
jgi:DNA recombination protein Rad52